MADYLAEIPKSVSDTVWVQSVKGSILKLFKLAKKLCFSENFW